MRLSRADTSLLTHWWFTVDRVLLWAILLLMAAGVVLSLAASPAVAIKKQFDTYYFVERHVLFTLAGALIMWAVSLLSPVGVRRLALGMFLASLAGLIAVHISGPEINGSRRWLLMLGYSIQPSEFLKPAFVVLTAWLLAEARERVDMPALPLAILAVVVVASLLVAQPDVGQTLLICAVWWAMFVLSGQPLQRAAALLICGAGGLGVAYWMFAHVRFRVDRFLTPLPGENSQINSAIKSFSEGGFLGRGPGEGTIKTTLPDAHTDFIFAVVAEEYGTVACLALLVLFAFIVIKALVRASFEPNAADRLSIAGLGLLFGLQALINMAVNVGLLPAKGITLPFISAGGSSMLAVSITLGMVLALTRHRPELSRLRKPRLAPRLEGFGSMGPST